MTDLQLEAAVERWVKLKDELIEAKEIADSAAKRVNELAVAQGEAAEIIGNRVGSNITTRVHKTKDGRCVLVEWHNSSFTSVTLHNFE